MRKPKFSFGDLFSGSASNPVTRHSGLFVNRRVSFGEETTFVSAHDLQNNEVERAEIYHQTVKDITEKLSHPIHRLKLIVNGLSHGSNIEDLREMRQLLASLHTTLKDARYYKFVKMRNEYLVGNFFAWTSCIITRTRDLRDNVLLINSIKEIPSEPYESLRYLGTVTENL